MFYIVDSDFFLCPYILMRRRVNLRNTLFYTENIREQNLELNQFVILKMNYWQEIQLTPKRFQCSSLITIHESPLNFLEYFIETLNLG